MDILVYVGVDKEGKPLNVSISRKGETHYEYLLPDGEWEKIMPLDFHTYGPMPESVYHKIAQLVLPGRL